MNYETATNKQLMNIASYDKDLPTYLLSGLALEMIKRRMWDGIIFYAGRKAYKNVSYVLERILKIDIEEFIQIAHIEIARIINTFKPGMRCFKSYVIMCLVGKFHVIREHAQAEKRASDLNTSDVDDLPRKVEETLLCSKMNVENYVINKITIEDAWNVLRDVEKKAIILEQMGYTQEEAAEMVGLNRRSGNIILKRAYAKLRKAMGA
jgi:RNA polymerase sigma factor (sigma-70 family)